MHFRWAVPGGTSGLKLSSPTSGDIPPDPPDPSSTLSLNQFPFLSPNLPKQTRSRSNSKSNPNPNSSVTAVVGSATAPSLDNNTVSSLATTLLATNPTILPDPTLSVTNLSTKLVPGSVLIPTTPLSTSSLPTNSVSQHQQFVTLPKADKLKAKEDKTLRRLAPVSISATGRPRVLIPDSVF
ncbi:hypothetical protein F2Q69_00054157 [Brassica cretica]|uniref:Uncharacterized protein n=1 Tax=Brassica cretica TaxID=69181 RepID=A0A8S9MWW7_BRACR|nr:hypothetical protein F2Q69_00054157 [Brassica cretica]